MLTLIHNTRPPHVDPNNWTFRPHLTGHRDDKQDFGEYGIYQVYVGNGAFGHELLVTFDDKGVRIQEVNEAFERVDISELDQPEFTLTHA